MKYECLRGLLLGGLLARSDGDPRGDPGDPVRWACEFAEGHEGRLSTWQIVKKGMWDRVREARIVSMHPNMLMQTAMTLESPEAVHECPMGLLACRFFLVDIIPSLSSHHDDEDTVAVWMEELLHELFDTPWTNILSSGWPIFGLLARLAKHQFTTFKKSESESIWQGISLSPTLSAKNALADLGEVQQMILRTLRDSGAQSTGSLLESFVQEGSATFWSRLSSFSEDLIFNKALQLGPFLHSGAERVALHFLRHLHDDFAGSSGSMDLFLQRILAYFSSRALSDMRCWDVGAAPWPDESNRHDRDVWEICASSGMAVEAFEPSQAGFDRLQAAVAAVSLLAPVQAHQLALSNATGLSGFNRGGQVTGSLGRRGCNSA